TEIEENYSLLPQVFFAEGEARLERTRMATIDKSRTSGFSESTLPKNTLDVYHELLNIVGQRMTADSSSSITLVGCNSNTGAERGNTELSRARAESVKAYLTSVWDVDPARISVKEQNLPSSPSNNASQEGQAENRRVEIIPSDSRLLSAVSIKNATVRAAPDIVEIVPSVTSEAGLASWTGTIVQEGRELRRFGGTSAPEPYTWNITGDPMPRLEKPVSVSLEVKDQTGLRKSAATSIEVSQLSIRQKRFEQRDDKRVDRFSLIVFDFNKADLSTENKRILSEVKARIQPNSTVTIAGYADRTGDPEYNKDLARKRCAEVEKAISGFSGPTTILPVGSDTLLYDNETPEGRSYCRTVQIVIETPTK
ncbi:MAG: OmpA family protein, partial [Candidatus Kapaibacterium sp.]